MNNILQFKETVAKSYITNLGLLQSDQLIEDERVQDCTVAIDNI